MVNRLTPVIEAAAGAGLASWVGLGAGIALLQTVIGADSAMNVGLVVNIGMLSGAAYLVFHAGSTFKAWRTEVDKASDVRKELQAVQRKVDLMDAQLAAYERVLTAVTRKPDQGE